MKIISTALMAMGLLLLFGCTPQPASITDEDLVGSWDGEGVDSFLQFNGDGTYSYSQSVFALETNPEMIGQYRLEGTLLTFITGDENDFCQKGMTGTYEVQLTEQGWLEFALSEDACEFRAAITSSYSWAPVSP